MGRHLVLVGAGHAHLAVLADVAKFVAAGYRVTVVSPDDFHYYSGMGPGMLAGIYRPQDIRFHVAKMVHDRGGRFIRGAAEALEPDRRRIRLRSGEVIGYDAASFNTGSVVPFDPPPGSEAAVFKAKPIENLLVARQRIASSLERRRLRLAVAGGGPTGVEIAANLRRLVDDCRGSADIVLVAGGRLLARFGRRVRRTVRAALARRRVELIEGARLVGFEGNGLRLSDGRTLEADFSFLAVGTRPSPLFAASSLATGDHGGLLVNARLQSTSHPEIFGGGDCISFQPRPLPRIGVYAVRQNPILRHNLRAALDGGPLQTFVPQKTALLILNLGDSTGILFRGRLVWQGRSAFRLKDAIDRRFMRKFQVSGEREAEEYRISNKE